MNWRERWINYFCKHHWHREMNENHVQFIDPKVCMTIQQTYYQWACCKCKVKGLFKFSWNPNFEGTAP